MKTIKEIDWECKLHNWSIQFDRNKNINGIKKSDYYIAK